MTERTPQERLAELRLWRGDDQVAGLEIHEHLELTEVQIGSMFVADDVAKTVLAPAADRRAGVEADHQSIATPWDIAYLRVPVPRLSRWQWLKLLHAPMLRRVSVRLRDSGGQVKLRIRRH